MAPPPNSEHEPRMSFGLGLDFAVERRLAGIYQLRGGLRLRPGYWLDAAVGVGGASHLDPAGSGQYDSSVYEGRAGVGRFGCTSSGCAGLVASVGFHHQRIDFADSLVEPEMWTETRDLVFGELRGVGRLRLGRYVALEAALGGRVHGAVRTERVPGGVNLGIVFGLALHAML